MIDWHSHVLPQMDDGSKSVEESVALLKMLSEQGVDTVIATPHFYADDESLGSFLKRREDSYKRLLGELPEQDLKLLLGAEVGYYSGIGCLDGLERLCIEGTDLLLLEMPFARWTSYMVREIAELASRGTVTVVLAHIERYIKLQGMDFIDELSAYGVLMQVNASFFVRRATRRTALKLCSNGKIQLIGSDTHGVLHRPPQLESAYRVIEKKLGVKTINEINKLGASLLV